MDGLCSSFLKFSAPSLERLLKRTPVRSICLSSPYLHSSLSVWWFLDNQRTYGTPCGLSSYPSLFITPYAVLFVRLLVKKKTKKKKINILLKDKDEGDLVFFMFLLIYFSLFINIFIAAIAALLGL